jgi:hypothetical protein
MQNTVAKFHPSKNKQPNLFCKDENAMMKIKKRREGDDKIGSCLKVKGPAFLLALCTY